MIQLSQFESPLGPIAVGECKGRLLAVEFGGLEKLRSSEHRLSRFTCCVLGSAGSMAAELRRYMSEPGTFLRVKVDLSLVDGQFDRLVLTSLFRTKRGTTLSYGQLAQRVGSPGACRAVGGAMRRNPLPIAVPCHRVLPASGMLGHYTGGAEKKAWLLAHEGVTFG